MHATTLFTHQSLKLLFTFLIAISQPVFTNAQLIVKVKPSDKGGIAFSDVTQHNTWNTATFELQKAIDQVQAYGGGQVWVAGGTYFPTRYLAAAPGAPNPPLQDPDDPDSPTDERQLSFIMASEVLVIGGFTGSEISPEDRPSDFFGNDNKVILSGDIGVPALVEDNTYHVVIFPPETDNTAILQNVVVSGGYANGPDVYFAKTGAGVHIREGGLLKECLVQNNVSAGSGGGVYLYKGGKTENCTIFENTAFVRGGGVYSNLGGEISKSAIYKNTAGNDTTDGKGGGVFLVADNTQEGTIINSEIFANNSTNKGGGIATYAGGQIINNYIGNNETTGKGGGVFLQNGGLVLNNTVVSNAGDQGAAIYCNDGGAIYNTVMWGNTTPYNNNLQISFDDDATTSSSPLSDFCAIQDGTSAPGIMNMISLSPENSGSGIHPKFKMPVSFSGIPSTDAEFEEILNSNYEIELTSALLDAGKTNLAGLPVPQYDLLNAPRITKSIIDIGAIEALYYHVNGIVNGGSGTISPNTTQKIIDGEDVEFILTPDAGYAIADFYINNIDCSLQVIDHGSWFSCTKTEISEDQEAIVEYSIPNTLPNPGTSGFLVYPNPAKEILFLKGASAKGLKIYNSKGQLIIDRMNLMNDEINISTLQKGVYFLVLLTENNQKITTKFIKE